MRIKQICVVMLVLFSSIGIEMRSAMAQVNSQPPKPPAVIPLEMIGDPEQQAPMPSATAPSASGPSGGVSATSPSTLGSNRRSSGANAAVSRLSNPFNGRPSPQAIHRHVGPSSDSASTPYPSAQGPNDKGRTGKATVGQLRNPFDGGASQGRKGLFGYTSPQYNAAPGLGGVPSGAYGPSATPGATPPGAAPTATPPGGTPGITAPGGTPDTTTPGGGAGATTPGTAPGAEATPGAGTPGTTPTPPAAGGGAGAGAGATGADAFGAAATTTGPGYGGALEAAVTPFAMIGDMSPLSIRSLATNASTNPGPPVPPGARGASPIYAAARNVKVSENQSPRPQDRIYFDFNYYNNVNDTINRHDLSPVTQMKVYTYLFGIEKTFNEGKGSIGIRVPLDTLTANSSQNVLSTPTSTSAGNLSIIGKYILEQNVKTGSLVSAGLAITAPSGPSRFAGAPYLFPLNSVYFQPYIGYIYNYKRWYIQGFSGFNFTSNINDVSYVFNDIGIGYYLLRDEDPRAIVSSVAPTFELHVNNPINHRDPYNRFDLAGMPDSVDLTFGLNFLFRRAAVLTFAYVVPVASPKPFDSEAALLLNIFYGRTRAGLNPVTPPPAL